MLFGVYSPVSAGCVQSPSAAFTQNRPLPATFFFFFFPLLHSLPLPETLEPPCLQFCLSLSGAFTQTRLLRPECVSAEILMLTYLSTLRSKSRRFLVSPQKCVFCKFAQHQHVASAHAPASLRKATPQPSPDHDLQKARWKAAPQPFHIIRVERQGTLAPSAV